VAIRFVLLADGISYATVSWIHMTILAIHVLFLGVCRQRRSGLRSNRQSCEQYDRPQCARSGNDDGLGEVWRSR